MELGTFGAIISFAMDLEQQAFNYYEGLKQTGLSGLTSQLISGSQKRINRLHRIRQELVTEMILEPITGLDSATYELLIKPDLDDAGLLDQTVQLETNLHHFYSNTAHLIPMKEVERAFMRLAAENEKRLALVQKSYPNG